jgi:hypothetical protein
MQDQAGLSDLLVEPVQSQINPEGFVSYTPNAARLLGRIRANPAIIYNTGMGGEHVGDVGKGNIDSRSRVWSGPPTLGPDTRGVPRSLQMTVGKPDSNGGALVYSDLDCVNPAESLLPALVHGVPIAFRKIGRFFGF